MRLARTHTRTHTHTARLIIQIHFRAGHPQTSQGFHCRPVLCRLHTQSWYRQFWAFSALQSDAAVAPVAMVPMETELLEESQAFVIRM